LHRFDPSALQAKATKFELPRHTEKKRMIEKGTSAPPAIVISRVLLISGLICFISLLLLLVLTADASPTTPTTRRLFGLWRVRSVLPAMGLTLLGTGLIVAVASRSHIVPYLSAIGSVIVTIAILEGIGLVGGVSWHEQFKPRSDQLGRLGTVRVPHLDAKGVTYQDTAHAWGIKTDPIPFYFRTDRYGFRNHKDRPTTDIILLGDSMLVAALLPFDKSVTALLENTVGRSVMQVALIGISPQEAHDLLWQAGLDLRGRHVVQFIFEGNDLLDSYHYRMKVAGQGEQRTLLFQEIWNQLALLTDRSRGLEGLRTCTIAGQLHTFQWGRNSFEGYENELQEITISLERFSRGVHNAGGRYSVVFVPKKLRVVAELCTFPSDSAIKNARSDIGPFRDEINAWRVRSGIPVLDLTEPLARAAEDGRIPWFWGDTHWNEVGHLVAANALAEWLVSR
jgi:hypothetical protein